MSKLYQRAINCMNNDTTRLFVIANNPEVGFYKYQEEGRPMKIFGVNGLYDYEVMDFQEDLLQSIVEAFESGDYYYDCF